MIADQAGLLQATRLPSSDCSSTLWGDFKQLFLLAIEASHFSQVDVPTSAMMFS